MSERIPSTSGGWLAVDPHGHVVTYTLPTLKPGWRWAAPAVQPAPAPPAPPPAAAPVAAAPAPRPMFPRRRAKADIAPAADQPPDDKDPTP